MNARLLTWAVAVLAAAAVLDGVSPTAAFDAARRAPDGTSAVASHNNAYIGIVTQGGSVPTSSNLTIGWLWNNGTAPLTFTAQVIEDPNNVVTRLRVVPEGEVVPVGGNATVVVTAHGAPHQDFPVTFEVTGTNTGVMRSTLTNLTVTIRILPGPGT